MEKIIYDNDINNGRNNALAICYWTDQIDLLTSNAVTTQSLPYVANKHFS